MLVKLQQYNKQSFEISKNDIFGCKVKFIWCHHIYNFRHQRNKICLAVFNNAIKHNF